MTTYFSRDSIERETLLHGLMVQLYTFLSTFPKVPLPLPLEVKMELGHPHPENPIVPVKLVSA